MVATREAMRRDRPPLRLGTQRREVNQERQGEQHTRITRVTPQPRPGYRGGTSHDAVQLMLPVRLEN